MKGLFIIPVLFCFNMAFGQDKGLFDAQNHIQDYIKTKQKIAFIQKAFGLETPNVPPAGIFICHWHWRGLTLPEKILAYILNKPISKTLIDSKDLSTSSSSASNISSYCYTCCSRNKIPPPVQETLFPDYLWAPVSSIKKSLVHLSSKRQARFPEKKLCYQSLTINNILYHK